MSSKKAFVIAVDGDAHIERLPMIQQFNYIFDFIGIEFAGYIIGNGNKPKEVIQDKNALFAATQIRNKLTINKLN